MAKSQQKWTKFLQPSAKITGINPVGACYSTQFWTYHFHHIQKDLWVHTGMQIWVWFKGTSRCTKVRWFLEQRVLLLDNLKHRMSFFGEGVIWGEDNTSISGSELANCRSELYIQDSGVKGAKLFLFIFLVTDEVFPEGWLIFQVLYEVQDLPLFLVVHPQVIRSFWMSLEAFTRLAL